MANPIEISLVDGISRGLVKISDGVNGLGANFVKLNAGVELFEKGLSFIGTAASGIGDLITPAADLEDALAAVQAVTGATAQEFDLLKNAAEGAAERTRFTAVEAAGGLAELARAGYTATQAIDALNPALNLAQGNNIAVAQSAELLSTTITQFGLSAKDAASVADVLQKTSDATSTSVEQLGLALSYAAPNAKALGFTLEETSAAIGVLANNGIRGERAGTVLREAFTQLQLPTSNLSKALAEAGVQVDSISGLFAALGNDSALAQRAMTALGVTGTALRPLIEDAGKSIGGLTKQLQDAQGAAQATADTLGSTFNSALARLTNSFDQAKITLLTPILEPLSKEIDLLAKQIFEFTKTEEFAKLAQGIKEFSVDAVASLRTFLAEFDFQAALTSIRQFVDGANQLFGELNTYLEIATTAAEYLKLTASLSAEALGVIGAAAGLSLPSVEQFGQAARTAAEASKEQAAAGAPLVASLQTVSAAATTATTAVAGIAAKSAEAGKAAKELTANLGQAAESGGQRFADAMVAVRVSLDGLVAGGEDAQKNFNLAISKLFAVSTAEDADALAQQVKASLLEMNADISGVDAAMAGFVATLKNAGRTNPLADLTEQFKQLGIQSQKSLDETVAKNATAFDAIAQAAKTGQIGISDVRAAFIAYAKSQIDAVKNADEFKRAQVEASLQSKAAASGLTESLAELGVVGKDASEKVAKGVQSIKPAADEAAASVQGVSSAMANAGSSASAATSAIQGNTSALITNAGAAQENAFFIGEMSDALAKQLAGAAGNVQETARLTEEIYRARDAASARLEQIQKEIALYDPLQKQLRAVKNEYRGIGDEQALALAREEQRLADLRDRANGTGGGNAGGTGGGTQTNTAGGAGSPVGRGDVIVNLSLNALDPASLDRATLLDFARQLTGPLRSVIAASG